MARVIKPDRLFARAAPKFLTNQLQLEAVTPLRDVVLCGTTKSKFKAKLYLKESQLTRLLFCRLDFKAALASNLIRTSPLTPKIEHALATTFRCAPWVTFGVDFI